MIGDMVAREGHEFVYCGPLTDCRECRLKTICFNLDQGCRYRIIGVRDVKHDCLIHENGVRVVEVEKIPVTCAIPSKYAIEGSTITHEPIKCNEIGCKNYHLCRPIGSTRNVKYRIVTTKGDIKCPKGDRLVKVVLD